MGRHPTFIFWESVFGLYALGVDTLRVSIDLQAFLRHLRILQKVQRHPDQMALDLVELLPDLLRRHERIVEMPLFELAVLRDKGLIIRECFD